MRLRAVHELTCSACAYVQCMRLRTVNALTCSECAYVQCMRLGTATIAGLSSCPRPWRWQTLAVAGSVSALYRWLCSLGFFPLLPYAEIELQ